MTAEHLAILLGNLPDEDAHKPVTFLYATDSGLKKNPKPIEVSDYRVLITLDRPFPTQQAVVGDISV